MPNNTLIMVGDVGGTHTRLAVAHKGQLSTASMTRLKNAEYASFEQLLQAFLARQPQPPQTAVFAVAGPVQNGEARMTNLEWRFNASAMAQTLGLAQVTLLNDLQAQGYAVPSLTSEVLSWVRTGSTQPEATALVVGLGTGVNLATHYWHNGQPWVPPAEAGHAHLPVRNELDFAFAQWLQTHRGFASVEEALSGQGLENLYQFHTRGEFLLAADVVAALSTGDGVAQQVGAHYVRLLAQTLAGWALTVLPAGGIYLVGGVARAMAPWLSHFEFAEHFTNMGRTSDWLRPYAVAVVQDDHAALHGAINLACTPNHAHIKSEWAGDNPLL